MMERLKMQTGWSYRRLYRFGECFEQTAAGYSSLMRWRDRLLAGKPLVRRHGPAKILRSDEKVLLDRVRQLKHRRKLTPGAGKLYSEYRDEISRREFRYKVANARREAHRNMRRVLWNQPGVAWTMDDTGRRGLPIPFKVSINQMRDLCSHKGLSAKVSEKLMPAITVAETLERLFKKHGAPLVFKRDNGKNLNGGAVNEVFRAFGVIALNSPPYYPQYNGQMERDQRELKGLMAKLLTGMADPDMDLVQQAAEFSLAEFNNRQRPCLDGKTSNTIFRARHPVMQEYTLNRRREVYDEIMTLAVKIMAHTGKDGRQAEQDAWRIAVEIWLRRAGLITVSVGGRVLPYYDPLLVS